MSGLAACVAEVETLLQDMPHDLCKNPPLPHLPGRPVNAERQAPKVPPAKWRRVEDAEARKMYRADFLGPTVWAAAGTQQAMRSLAAKRPRT